MTKLKKAKQLLKSFLLAKGVHYLGKNDTWTGAYIRWLRSFKFDLEDDHSSPLTIMYLKSLNIFRKLKNRIRK